ncbi:MAG: DUF3320 domain-containing protein [Thermomicrobiales bacterium]
MRSGLPKEHSERVALRLLKQPRASEQEQGINILFAAFGVLHWREKPDDATFRSAPLVLMPVKIEETAREGGFRIAAGDDGPELNPTLVEKLKRDFGLTLAVEIEEATALSDILAEVRATVAKQSGWEVVEHVHLGLFQFHKLRMFKDLQVHEDIAARHDIVRALALDGMSIGGLPEGVPDEDQLDRAVKPMDSFTILDADASQLRAVQAAVRGANLIIHGPPGTGKSQTIANIIAECIAAGKTVLFVSEKAAAIEVVHRRLTANGLGDYALMLHSQKASKREIIQELGRRLQGEGVRSAIPDDDLGLRRLGETRAQLNDYVDALHGPRAPFQRTVFDVHGELARLSHMPFLDVDPPDIEHVTEERLDTWLQQIDAVTRVHDVLIQGNDHPWAGVSVTSLSLAEQQSLKAALNSLATTLADVHQVVGTLADELTLDRPATLAQAHQLIDLLRGVSQERAFRPDWFDSERIGHIRGLADESLAMTVAAQAVTDDLSTVYGDGLTELATADVLTSYRRGSFGRFFSSSHRTHRAQLRTLAKDGRRRPHPEELATLEKAADLRGRRAWFAERAGEIQSGLGMTLRTDGLPDQTAMRKTSEAIAVVASVLPHLPRTGASPTVVNRLCTPSVVERIDPLRQALAQLLAAVDRSIAALGLVFQTTALQAGGRPFVAAEILNVAQWADDRRDHLHELDAWFRARRAVEQAEAAGIGHVVTALLDHDVPADEWAPAFRRLVLTHWLDLVRQGDPRLSDFHGVDRQAMIDRFQELDRESIRSATQRIQRTAEGRRSAARPNGIGEPGILRHEYNKRRAHKPLRWLFERTPNLIQTLAPCLMMSPLSVAHFLPADRYSFDVVLFDEASQVRPYDAIGAIMRGRQLVVAGDPHQLPPSSFFDRVGHDDVSDDEQEQDTLALDSILDALRAKGMQDTFLSWHYRSRHEDLIAFSNLRIYEDRLITFPSPSAKPLPDRGVRLEYVSDGLYEDAKDGLSRRKIRINRREARRVAELVMLHARTRPGESLGVVALGVNQRDVLDEEIDNLRALDRRAEAFFQSDKPEPFFVKALEQVQGDERDVIMISIGYGKTAEGRLSHNFGPINQDGGERRLNVLVTRAKNQIVVVSSITSGDIDLSRNQSRGVRLLKLYLDFAERGPTALAAETSGDDGFYESPFEEEVGEALERAGYIVRRQVGVSRFRIELAIVDPDQPGRYLLGIECDGAAYHSAKTARDRDRLRQEILEGLGWTFHRIWSTDWIRHPDRELDKLIAHIEEVRAVCRDQPAAAFPTVHDAGEFTSPIAPSESDPIPTRTPAIVVRPLVPFLAPYQEADLKGFGVGDLASAPTGAIVRAAVACVAVEAPIHEALLARRIAACWGIHRIGSRIGPRLASALASAVRDGLVEQRGQFVWLPGQRDVVVRGAAADGVTREIGHVPGEELLAAFAMILTSAMSLTEDELIQQSARFLGYQRTAPDIALRLRGMVQLADANGRIVRQNGRIQLPRSNG